jgi:hypothetical protein
MSIGATSGADKLSVVFEWPPTATTKDKDTASAAASSDSVICESPPKTTKAVRIVATVFIEIFSIVHLLELEREHFLGTPLEEDPPVHAQPDLSAWTFLGI